jgi:biopolymer transport protein ExbB/TolQ
MMENESLREPKNTTVMLLVLCLVVVGILAIVGFAKSSSRAKDIDRLTADKEMLRTELEQVRQDSQIKVDQAEKLRLTALEWTRQHQLQIQAEMRKKEEAAKLAKQKEATVKKPVTTKPTTTTKGKATPVKKSTSTKVIRKA